MRNKKGQFQKGFSASPKTQFKKGQHWRKPQAFRQKEWLIDAYVNQEKSASDIAKQFGVTDASIYFWLRKHGIPRRSISSARALKHWELSGVDNPMWNKKGELNHNWKGGITADRQSFYVSQEWKTACSFVWERDKRTCQRCNLIKEESADMPFHIHHIKSFADKDLRSDPENLILLCEACHRFVHSKKNTTNEFIQKD